MIRSVRSLRAIGALSILALTALASCTRTPSSAGTAAAPDAPPPTNRVDINAAVRQNLGITFAKVEERNVARTLRVPGRFELMPTARREYRLPVAGQVELLVAQYQPITAGTPLLRIDAPAWRELQRELADASAQLALAQASVDSIGPFMEAHEAHHREIQKAVDLGEARVAKLEALEAAGGARGEDVAQAQAALAAARSDLAETLEKEAELATRRSVAAAQLDAARTRQAILLRSAASLTEMSVDELVSAVGDRPRWQTIDRIEIAAQAPGVIDELHAVSGAFLEQNSLVLDTVQPDQVRFRANALQSDLGRLADKQAATVVAPQGGSLSGASALSGTLTLAPTADPDRRTIEVVMTPALNQPAAAWAKAGVAGFLEIVTDGAGAPELAIPLSCVARDGTQTVIFRRDPANPDQAIRMEADLGLDDGRWVVIKSGVAEGNEIVLDGVYQLMVATSGSVTKGGHFHSDGTFHEGKD